MTRPLWRRAFAFVAALMLATTASASLAAPAEAPKQVEQPDAYPAQTMSHKFLNSNIRYCFVNYGGNLNWTTTEKNVAKAGINLWASQTDITVTENCSVTDVILRWDNGTPAGNVPATTNVNPYWPLVYFFVNGEWLTSIDYSVVYINANFYNNYWISTATQSCNVENPPSGCKWDLKSVVAHEFGHAIGLNHYGENLGTCLTGRAANNFTSACNYYGEQIMNTGDWNGLTCPGGIQNHSGGPGVEFNCNMAVGPNAQGHRHNDLGPVAKTEINAVY